MEFGARVVGVAAGDSCDGVFEEAVPTWVAIGPGCSYARSAPGHVGIRDVGVGSVDTVGEKIEVRAGEIVSGVLTTTLDVIDNAGAVGVCSTV